MGMAEFPPRTELKYDLSYTSFLAKIVHVFLTARLTEENMSSG